MELTERELEIIGMFEKKVERFKREMNNLEKTKIELLNVPKYGMFGIQSLIELQAKEKEIQALERVINELEDTIELLKK